MNEFAGAVHVAQGNADEAGGNAGSAELHGVGIGSGSAGFGVDLHWDLLGFGGLDQQIK